MRAPGRMEEELKQLAVLDALLSNWSGIVIRLGKASSTRSEAIESLATRIVQAESPEDISLRVRELIRLIKNSPAEKFVRTLLKSTQLKSKFLSKVSSKHLAIEVSSKPRTIGVRAIALSGLLGAALSSFSSAAAISSFDKANPIQRVLDTTRISLKKKAMQDSQYCLVKVYYGTDRKATSKSKVLFTGQQASAISYGSLEVTIPVGVHKTGQIERHRFWHLLHTDMDPRRYMVLHSEEPLSEGSFITKLGSDFDESKELLVFVHGYNVNFEAAARRAAQLAFDLEFPGRVVLFSWPSIGMFSGYNHDAEQALNSAKYFIDFLRIIEDGPWSRVHLLGHSMGNRLLFEGLSDNEWPNSKIGQIIYAAADINVERFKQRFYKFSRKGLRYTSYASRSDKALLISDIIHHFERVGRPQKAPFVMKGMETVDVSNAKSGIVGHGYFAESAVVLKDISTLLTTSQTAFQRGLRQPKMKKHWLPS